MKCDLCFVEQINLKLTADLDLVEPLCHKFIWSYYYSKYGFASFLNVSFIRSFYGQPMFFRTNLF